MKRSPRFAVLFAVLMLISTCVGPAPSWALLGPIKQQGPDSIGEPGDPGGVGKAMYSPLGGFAVIVVLPSPMSLFQLVMGMHFTSPSGGLRTNRCVGEP